MRVGRDPPRHPALGAPVSVKQLSELPALVQSAPLLGKLRHNQGKNLAKVIQGVPQK